MTATKPMTVAALIKDLEALPQHAEVFRFVPTATESDYYRPFTRLNIQFRNLDVVIY